MFMAPAPPVAVAAQAPRTEFHAYRVTAAAGSERVEFAGDPAAGCADRGVCGVSGTETFTPVRPDTDSLATFVRISGRVSGQAFFSGGNSTASVTTAGADGTCTDAFYTRQAVVTFRRAGLRVQATLHGPVGEPPLGQDAAVFATHCAGPRIADLARANVLPRAIVPVSQLRRAVTVLPLSAETPFSAAGFSGRVVSDIRVRIKRDRQLERALLGSGTLTISGGVIGGASP